MRRINLDECEILPVETGLHDDISSHARLNW